MTIFFDFTNVLYNIFLLITIPFSKYFKKICILFIFMERKSAGFWEICGKREIAVRSSFALLRTRHKSFRLPWSFRPPFSKGGTSRRWRRSRSAEREISLPALFFLIAFSFAAAMAKEKAGIDTYAKHVCRRRRDGGRDLNFCFGCWRDFNSCFYIKNTFLLSYFSVTKSTKSHLRTFPP